MNIAFALEYSLGHVTHAQNLKCALQGDASVRPSYFEIPFDDTPLPAIWSRLGPIRNNWSARASLAAYYAVRSVRNTTDAAFFHTQVTSLFSPGLMRSIPSIVSLDATPLQYDALGASYGHEVGSGPLETIKKTMNERSFRAARHLVTWSQWAKDSLIADYSVSGSKITVIPPGIDLEKWQFARDEPSRATRFLFVGGDFARKGGDTLLAAFRSLRARQPDAELHVATKTEGVGAGEANVFVHRGLTPNSPALMQLYAQADAFAFPTRADCLPLAVMEAQAAGLPVITTRVGALGEAVTDGVTGFVVAPDDPAALAAAMERLCADRGLRGVMSDAARENARAKFDAAVNYRALVDLLKSVGA